MEKKQLARMPRIFYGYWIVIAAFLLLFIQAGCGFFAFSLFIRPLQADLGWSRGPIMAAFTIYFLTVGLASPFVGRFIDYYEARKIILGGGLLGGLGFSFMSLMNNLWLFYAGYAIVGAGMAAIGYVPASTVVSSWFKKRRGLAIGVMSTGMGLGGVVLAPLIGAYAIPQFGWRVAYLTLAVITWGIIIPLALFVIRTKPEDRGLYPDGLKTLEENALTEASLPISGRLNLKMALASPAFWMIAISFLLSGLSQVGIIQSQVPYLEDIGFPAAMAATALAGVGLASAIGKFGFGWLCDLMPAKYACSVGVGLQLLSVIILMNVGLESALATIWLYSIMMGLGVGSWYPTMSMLVGTHFGLASYGAVFGAIILAISVGAATGPFIAGYLYDTLNSFHRAFFIFLLLYAISIPLILVPRHPKAP